MQEICRVLQRIADTQAPVLILGESGVGKGAIAAAIHHRSHRSSHPLIHVDCGGVSAEEFAHEFFGSVRDDDRSAGKPTAGRFAEAEGGTLFLKQIDHLPLVLQARLLGALQDGKLSPAGNPQSLPSGPRVIAASDRDLRAEVDAGRFREDLYWWLNVVPLEIPPLRSRSEDIPALVTQFLERSNERNGRRVTRVAREALDALQAYPWPGNVPELRTYVERAVVMADGEELSLELLPEALSGIAPIRSGGLSRFDLGSLTEEVVAQGIATVADDDPHPELHSKIVNSVERELMLQVLRGCNGVRTQAAARLGINRNTLHKKIKEYGLDTESPDSSGGA